VGADLIADLPALPLHTAGKYVAGAYVVLFALVLIYVAIMAIRLSRIERELGELLACLSPDMGGAREGELSGRPGEESPPARAADVGEPESTLAYPMKGHT